MSLIPCRHKATLASTLLTRLIQSRSTARQLASPTRIYIPAPFGRASFGFAQDFHPSNDLFGAIVRPGNIFLPVKHPKAVPMFAQADQQIAQLLQRGVHPSLTGAAFGDLLPQFKQAPAAIRRQFGEQSPDFFQEPLPFLGQDCLQLSQSVAYPSPHMELSDLLLQPQLLRHREEFGQVVRNRSRIEAKRCASNRLSGNPPLKLSNTVMDNFFFATLRRLEGR